MNNQELLVHFRELSKIENPFDCIMELKNFERQYKKSDFFKACRISVYNAFELFNKMSAPTLMHRVNELLESDNLAVYLNDILNEVDPGLLINKILYGINYEQLYDLIKQFVPDISLEQLKSMGQELQGVIEKLKT